VEEGRDRWKRLRIKLALSRRWWQSRGGLDACVVVREAKGRQGLPREGEGEASIFVDDAAARAQLHGPHAFGLYNSPHTYRTHTQSTPTHASETLLSTPQGLLVRQLRPPPLLRSALLISKQTRCMGLTSKHTQTHTQHRQSHTEPVHPP
jgi:hypothetical protein